MAEIVRYVNLASVGGDGTTNAITGPNAAYASLSAWSAAEATNLVTDGNTHRVYCEGGLDSTPVDLGSDGWTQNATHFITIEVTVANRHNGTFGTGYRFDGNAGVYTAWLVLGAYTRIIGVSARNTGTVYGGDGITISSYAQIQKGLVSSRALTGAAAISVNSSAISAYIFNTVINNEGNSTGGILLSALTDGARIYNNTIVNCDIGMNDIGGYVDSNIYLENNVFFGNTTDVADNNATWAAADYNATDAANTTALDALASGTHNVANIVSGDFTNTAGDDYSLASGSNLLDVGNDLSAYLTDDVIDTARPQNSVYDIGAFERAGTSPSAAISGTAAASITEADIVNGGKTIIITLTNDTFVAAGTGPIGSTADTQAIIDGVDSAQSEANGWDVVVKVGLNPATDVVRTGDTVCTITLPAFANYNIAVQELITATIPGAVLTDGSPVVASPTFTVDPVTISITDEPITIARGQTSIHIGASGGGFGATQGVVRLNGVAGPVVNIESWADTDIYVGIPSDIAIQHDITTGYTLHITTDSVDTVETSATPFTPPAGWDFTDIAITPVTTLGSVFYGYTGDPPVIGAQVVYTRPMTPDGIDYIVGSDGELIWYAVPPRDQTALIYVINADGTLGTVAVFTWAVLNGVVTIITTGMGMMSRFGKLGVH